MKTIIIASYVMVMWSVMGFVFIQVVMGWARSRGMSARKCLAMAALLGPVAFVEQLHD